MYLIAHRGNSQIAPENTLASINDALKNGATGIEIDVALTKDHELVVFHDKKLNRTTDGKGYLSAYTLAQLKILDAGNWFSPNFKGEQIPTLEEVLTLVAGKARLYIEIKEPNKQKTRLILTKLFSLLGSYNAYSWTALLSFYDHALNLAHTEFGHPVELMKFIFAYFHPLPVQINKPFALKRLKKYPYVDSFGFDYRVTPRLIKYLHSIEKKCYLGARRRITQKELNKLESAGLDGIMRNDVAQVLSVTNSNRTNRLYQQ